MTAVSERAPGVRATANVRLREQVRVAILFDNRQTDMVLPATETVATLIADILRDLLDPDEAIRKRDSADTVTPGKLMLTRITGTALNRGQSLREQGINDGAVLILKVEDAEVSFTPVIENASSAIAQFNARRYKSVTPQTAIAFAAASAAVGSVVAAALLFNAWRLGLATRAAWPLPALIPSILAAGEAALLLAAGAVAWWRRRSRLIANGLWTGAIVSAGTAAFIAVPGPAGPWNVMFTAATVALLAVVLWRLSPAPRGILAWLTLVGGGVVGIALLRAIGLNMTYLWVGSLFVALLVLKSTETLSQLLARVPMPPFPTVTGKLAFDNADDIAAEALVAAEMEGTPSVEELQYAAAEANTYQQAIVAATAPFFIAGAAGAVTVGHGRWWLASIYVLTIAAVLVFRGRSLEDRAAALTVVTTAFAMSGALGLKYALTSHDPRMSIAVAAMLGALGLAALFIASVVPSRMFSAPFRKGVEWLDYGLQVLIPPTAFWLLNLYYLTRNAL